MTAPSTMPNIRTYSTLAQAQRAATEWASLTQCTAVVNMPNGRRLVIDYDGEAWESAGWVSRRHPGAIFTTTAVEGKMR